MLTKTSSPIVAGLTGAAVVLDLAICARVSSVGAVAHQSSLGVGALASIATRRLVTARGQAGAGGTSVPGRADTLRGEASEAAGADQGIADATIVTGRLTRAQHRRGIDITKQRPVIA